MRLSILINLLFLLSLTVPSWASDEFTFYIPQNRAAEDLVPLVQGLFSDRAQIIAAPNKIIINAPRETANKIKSILGELDKKPVRFQVYARVISASDIESRAEALEIHVRNGSSSLKKQSGLLVKEKSANINIGGSSILAANKHAYVGMNSNQFTFAMEGRESVLSFGDKETLTKLAITAKAMGDNGVNVKIKQMSAMESKVHSLQSEVDIKLGTWNTIGNLTEAKKNSASEIFGSANSSLSDKKLIQLKLIKIKDNR